MRNQSAQEITTPINGRHNGNILGTNDEYGVDEHTKDHEKEKRRTIGATCTHTHRHNMHLAMDVRCFYRFFVNIFFFRFVVAIAVLLLLPSLLEPSRTQQNTPNKTRLVFEPHTHNTNRL